MRATAIATILTGAALAAPTLSVAKTAPPDWATAAAAVATPAYAHNAPAVILMDDYLVTVDGSGRATERERFAVRILKPSGSKYANCEESYDIDEKLLSFKAWTVTADGKQLEAEKSDFTDYGRYDSPILQMSERIRQLRPLAADPGNVVVCEMEKQMRPKISEEMLELDNRVPAVEQSLELALPSGMQHSIAWHRHEAVKPIETPDSHLRWELHDTPALDLEDIEARPSFRALASRVSLQWGPTAAHGLDAQWQAIAQWEIDLEAGRQEPTPEITAQAQQLTAGVTDFYDKLQRITDYVQKNIRYFVVMRGIGGWQPHTAGEIYQHKYGDCKDKATLLIALLKAAGINAHSLSVDTFRGVVDPTMPSRYSNHMITAIEIPAGNNDPRLMARAKTNHGTEVLIFDPTDQDTPVGGLRADLQDSWAVLADGAHSQILHMPLLAPDSAGTIRTGHFTLAASGLLDGTIHQSSTGDDALYWRGNIHNSDAKEMHDSIEHILGSQMVGLNFKGYEMHELDVLNKPFGLDLHLSSDHYIRAAGPLLIVRPRVMGSHLHAPSDVMDNHPRSLPIVLGYPGHWHDSYDIELPAGYVVDELPDPVKLDTAFASYHSNTTSKGNLLHYECDYTVRTVTLEASEAAALRSFENALMNDEKSAAILRKQ